MTRALFAAAIVLACATRASAEPSAQVESELRKLLDAPPDKAAQTAALRADAIALVDGERTAIDGNLLVGFAFRDPRKVYVSVDAAQHVAWFQTVTEATISDTTGDACAYNGACAP